MAEYLQLRDLHKVLNADVVKKARSRGGSPPWLKDMAGQLEDPEYVSLSLADRGFLKDLRLLALRRGNKILNDEQYLRGQLRLTVRTRTGPYVSRLRAAGFLEAYDETTNNAAAELNPQLSLLEQGENDSGLEVEVDKEEPLPLQPPAVEKPERRRRAEPTTTINGSAPASTTKLRYLKQITAIAEAHPDDANLEQRIRVYLEGFTGNETEIAAHLAAVSRARVSPDPEEVS